METVRKPRVVCVTQARMTSTRLPGKVLMTAAGRPLLAHHLERLQRSQSIDQVVLATTNGVSDDPVAALGGHLGVAVFRGDEFNVLQRYAQAAAQFNAEIVIRVTADCPLIDPDLIDAMVGRFCSNEPPLDYLGLDMACYPRGLDAEIFPRAVLDEAAAHGTADDEREHVTRYIYRRPERFRLGVFEGTEPWGHYRWCVDEASDLELIRRILEALTPTNPYFTWKDCLNILEQHPDWIKINQAVRQKT
ncbi:spore coat polysaccharide biosynthesis protein SpsF [Azospirillaceae bacterium]